MPATTQEKSPSPKGPVTVGEVVNAWQRSGRRAAALQQKLEVVSKVSRQRYEDLTRLAKVTRKRRQQNERLQAKLMAVLERQSKQPEALPDEAAILQHLEGEASDQDQVPIHYARVLLKRLQESQKIVEEYDTLLQLRERQVQEMLPAFSVQKTGGADDFVVIQLQKELDQMRHRVRLLTAELVYPSDAPTPAAGSEVALERDRLAARVHELESTLQTLHTSQESAENDLVGEVSGLQDEVARLQEEVDMLRQDDAAGRLAQAESFLVQLTAQINQLTADNEGLRGKLATGGASSAELEALRKQNQDLQQQLAAASPQTLAEKERSVKLEAAVVDLKAKLQLAASKYQEVKEALLKKHKQLQDLQSHSAETEKSSEFTVSVVQTLESARGEAKRQAESRQEELEKVRVQLAETEKKLAEKPPAGAPAEEADGDPGSLEAKLKEARRSAVRAQAEAGLKRKEAAKLQEEIEGLKAKLKAAGLS